MTLPNVFPLAHYKTNEEGKMVEEDGPEYYNNSVPWKGFVIDYFNAILTVSNIPRVEYTFRSLGAAKKGHTSKYTQAVSDVEAGITDIAISSFWATTERYARRSMRERILGRLVIS